MNNQAAQDAYLAAYAEAMAYLGALTARLEDAPAPDENTTWSDVAGMAHLVDQLREIVEPSYSSVDFT